MARERAEIANVWLVDFLFEPFVRWHGIFHCLLAEMLNESFVNTRLS
jgi:hypothetical protein